MLAWKPANHQPSALPVCKPRHPTQGPRVVCVCDLHYILPTSLLWAAQCAHLPHPHGTGRLT